MVEVGEDELERLLSCERLLRRCRAFVYRAMNPGKVPHNQDQKDAELIWDEIIAAVGEYDR